VTLAPRGLLRPHLRETLTYPGGTFVTGAEFKACRAIQRRFVSGRPPSPTVALTLRPAVAHPGVGVSRSTDEGASWSVLRAANPRARPVQSGGTPS
jgi:hypothetical protein